MIAETSDVILGVGPNGPNFQKCSIRVFLEGLDPAESESGLEIVNFAKVKKTQGG